MLWQGPGCVRRNARAHGTISLCTLRDAEIALRLILTHFLRSLTVKKWARPQIPKPGFRPSRLLRDEDERLLTAPTTGHPVSRRQQDTRHHAQGDDGARRSGLFDVFLRWDFNLFDFVTVRARTETGGQPNPTTSASLSHRPAVLSPSQNAQLVFWTMPSRPSSWRLIAVRPQRPSRRRRE